MGVVLVLWVVFEELLDLVRFVLVAIIFVDDGGEGNFDVATYLSSILSVAITYTEQVHRGQALNIRRKDILILINFIWVMWMVPNSCRKCKLPDTILSLSYCLLLGILAFQWGSSSRGIVGLGRSPIFLPQNHIALISVGSWARRRGG